MWGSELEQWKKGLKRLRDRLRRGVRALNTSLLSFLRLGSTEGLLKILSRDVQGWLGSCVQDAAVGATLSGKTQFP